MSTKFVTKGKNADDTQTQEKTRKNASVKQPRQDNQK